MEACEYWIHSGSRLTGGETFKLDHFLRSTFSSTKVIGSHFVRPIIWFQFDQINYPQDRTEARMKKTKVKIRIGVVEKNDSRKPWFGKIWAWLRSTDRKVWANGTRPAFYGYITPHHCIHITPWEDNCCKSPSQRAIWILLENFKFQR